jgi:hypothetical protein
VQPASAPLHAAAAGRCVAACTPHIFDHILKLHFSCSSVANPS